MMIDKTKLNHIKKELQYCLLAGLISLAAAYFFLGLKSVDLNVPFSYGYGGDSYGGLTVAQNFITGNGRYLYPNMGAPGVVTQLNTPDSSTLHYFGMWILSLFIKEPGLLVNIFYILTFLFISISATISLRFLNINPMASILGGVLYSLLPYHFYRRTAHLFLSTYAIVPFVCVLILWIINGEIYFNKFNVKTGIAVIIAIFIGMDNSYYIFFSCSGILFAIVWNFLEEKNFKKTFSSSIILLAVIFSILINMLPYIISVFNGVDTFFSRSPSGVEIRSLKFIQLILPAYNHRFHLFSAIRSYYEKAISFHTSENAYISSLGLFISAGLIASLFISILRRTATTKNRSIDINIQHSAILNVFMVILGSVGGISSLIALIFYEIRCYNRLSIFIAFYSLYIISYYLSNFLAKLRLRFVMKLTIIVLLGIIFAFDQVADEKLAMLQNTEYSVL